MAQFLPFRGIRYAATELSAVTAPPYDVIDPDERAALAARDPHNAVRLILPDGGDERYARSAAELGAWQAAGVLRVDPAPRFYVTRVRFRDGSRRDRETLGMLGALRLPERADSGDVLPHERTLARARSDRLALLRATRANLDPIWGLSLTEGLPVLLAPVGAPLARATDTLGVQHELFALPAEREHALAEAVASTPIVLADGHHRFETALAYRDERREAGAATPGDDAILTLVVELADHQLWVQPIHRLLSGLAPAFDIRAALRPAFTIHDAGPNTTEGVRGLEARMVVTGGLGLVEPDGLALLVPEPDALAPALAPVPAPLRGLDATRFEAGVLAALPEGATCSYRNDATTCAALVGKGAARAAVLLRPVSVADIHAVAAAGLRMPQKTTFFAPKPLTGLVFRSLDL